MSIKCECGGTLRRVKCRSFDFTAFAGLPVELRGFPGLRCDKCGGETLDGKTIDAVLVRLTQEILKLPRVLVADEAKFLRRRLGLSQKELAKRMGLSRETVGYWECGQKPLSPQNDYILRGLTIGATTTNLKQVVTAALGQVHAKSEAAPEPFVIAGQLAA